MYFYTSTHVAPDNIGYGLEQNTVYKIPQLCAINVLEAERLVVLTPEGIRKRAEVGDFVESSPSIWLSIFEKEPGSV